MKGHSQRVPKKNLRSFCGEPLFFRIASELEKCDFVEKIIINTDSEEIANLATQNFKKVVIVNRPAKLIGDDVPMNDIISYDLLHQPEDYWLQTHSTNPLLTHQTLKKAWNEFILNVEQGHESLFSVTKLQTRLYDHKLNPINHSFEKLLQTQDLPPVYEENSNFYFFTRNSFLENKRRIGRNFKVYELDKIEALDIDNEVDFKLAEFAYQSRL